MKRYRKEVDKLNYNGAVHSLTNSLMFIPSSTQFWSISLDLMKNMTADRSNDLQSNWYAFNLGTRVATRYYNKHNTWLCKNVIILNNRL